MLGFYIHCARLWDKLGVSGFMCSATFVPSFNMYGQDEVSLLVSTVVVIDTPSVVYYTSLPLLLVNAQGFTVYIYCLPLQIAERSP